jgi:hypothetical protein
MKRFFYETGFGGHFYFSGAGFAMTLIFPLVTLFIYCTIPCNSTDQHQYIIHGEIGVFCEPCTCYTFSNSFILVFFQPSDLRPQTSVLPSTFNIGNLTFDICICIPIVIGHSTFDIQYCLSHSSFFISTSLSAAFHTYRSGV